MSEDLLDWLFILLVMTIIVLGGLGFMQVLNWMVGP